MEVTVIASPFSSPSAPPQPNLSTRQPTARMEEEPENITTCLESLRGTMERIRATLLDAEDEIDTPTDLLRQRLDNLQSLAHDIEDVLDLYNYELRRAESQQPQEGTEIPPRVRGPAQVPLLEAPVICEIKSRALGLQERVYKILEEEDYLHVDDADDDDRGRFGSLLNGGPVLPKEGRFFGRKDDLEELVRSLLVSDEELRKVGDDDDQPPVIAVVGMGGVGKTSLLQQAYDDRRVCQQFGSNRGWVTVTDGDFDVVRLTRETHKSFTGESYDLETFDPLQRLLNEKVRENKFLLVLDDVWNTNIRFWDSFRSSFRNCSKGSRILVATRNQEVADAMQASRSCRLSCLSPESSWLLFQQYAFDHDKPIEEKHFKVVLGQQIVRKCEGLPLAIKVIGGLLRNEDGDSRWEDVLRSDLWRSKIGEGGILASLRLSYFYLPVCLKCCFAYCAVFPRGYRISKKELFQLWMAHDLIQDNQGKPAWEIGMNYIDDLLSRSFFQPSPIEKKEAEVVIHSLIHDLAGHVSAQQCLRIVDNEWSLCAKIRYASLWSSSKNKIWFPSFEQIQGLRTLLVFGSRPLCLEIQTHKNFTFLRVLDLNGSNVNELPDFIGNLKLLRHLRVGHNTHIKVMPESICTLYNLRLLDFSCTSIEVLPGLLHNLKLLQKLDLQGSRISVLPESLCMICGLQTLELTNCRRLQELPRRIGELTNLRFLSVDNDNRISYLPVGIGRLVNLQSLEWFPVGSSTEHAGIKELQHLIILKGRLSIIGLCNVTRAEDAKAANMLNKEYLQKLTLDWEMNSEVEYVLQDKEEDQIAEQNAKVLANLQPHVNLEELKISRYCGVQFPQWLRNPKLNWLVRLNLFHCQNCTSLSDLDQLPFLMHLHIKWMPSLEKVRHCTGVTRALRYFSREFYRSRGFPRRRELVIYDCPNLTSLQVSVLRLEIKGCENLNSIDFQGKSLIHLKISDCPQLHFTSQTCLPSGITTLEIDNCPLLMTWCPQHNDQVNEIILDGNLISRSS